MGANGVKVELDREACIGNGMCRAAAPSVFGADPEGLATLVDPEAAALEALLDAAASCPVGAIGIRDAKTNDLARLDAVLELWRGREIQVAAIDLTAPGEAVLTMRNRKKAAVSTPLRQS